MINPEEFNNIGNRNPENIQDKGIIKKVKSI